MKWVWSIQCSQAVKTARQLMTTSTVSIHYDYTLPLKLAADASSYWLGIVISHVLPDGIKRPIAFASWSLLKSEWNYTQIDKKALRLIFGVLKFHSYLYGRKLTLTTDYKPLTTILGPKKGVMAERLQQWAIVLGVYHYDIEFHFTVEQGNSDDLSCLPLPEGNEQSSETSLCNILQIEVLPLSSQEIMKATRRDPTLSKV